MNGFVDVFLSWILAFLAWAPAGLWAVSKLNGAFYDRPIHHLILGTLVGAAINSAILALLSFWVPVHYYLNFGLALANIILFRKTFISGLKGFGSAFWNWSWIYKIGMVVFAAIAVVCTLHISLNNDSGLYYIQFIEWMNSYPVVPGLANLHDRFGFNSHWHLLSAGFNIHEQFGSGTNDLNALIFILIGFGFFDSANQLSKQLNLFDLIWVLFPLPLFFLLRFLTSASPDLPVTLIPLVYFSYLIYKKDESSLPVLAILLSFIVTLKVFTALHFLATLPLLYWVIKAKNYRSIVIAAFCGLMIGGPWIGRNVVQTGYVVFPMESIDLVNVEWKVPPELSSNARKQVATHARTGSYDVRQFNAPMSEWLGTWLSARSKPMLGIIASAGLGSLLLLLMSLLKLFRKKDRQLATLTIFMAGIVLMSLALWWITGPNPRFVYGIVFFFFAYTIAFITSNFNLSKWLRFVPILALLPMLMIARTVLADKGPKLPTEFDSFELDGTTVSYPTKTDKCWTQPLPCTTRERDDLKMRRDDVEDGFMNVGSVR